MLPEHLQWFFIISHQSSDTGDDSTISILPRGNLKFTKVIQFFSSHISRLGGPGVWNPGSLTLQPMLLTKRLSCLLELPRAYFARCCAVLSRFSRVWLHNPMERILPGSSAHGILQAKILEWVAVSSSRGSSRPRDQTHISYVSCIGRRVLYHSTTWEAPLLVRWSSYTAHLMLTATFWDGAFVLSF